MYLVQIPRRKGLSNQRVVHLATERFSPMPSIHGLSRDGPNGRDLKLQNATRIEQPLPNLDLFVGFLICP
jgi:hypothetical protein